MKDRLLYAYLATLFWIPIPLASYTLPARSFVVLLCCGLAALTLWHVLKDIQTSPLPPAFIACIPVWWLFGLIVIWHLLQFCPLPVKLIEFLSPNRLSYLNSDKTFTTLALYPWQTKQQLLYTLGYISLFMLTVLLVDTKARLKKLLYTILAMGILQSVYAGFITLSNIEKSLWFDKTSHLGDATGTFINRNHLANYLMYCIAIATGLLISLSGKSTSQPLTIQQKLREISNWLLGSQGFIRIAMLVMVIGLLLTHSRMGNVAFFIGITTAGFFWTLCSKKKNWGILLFFTGLLVIDLFLVGAWFGMGDLMSRFTETDMQQEARLMALPSLLALYHDFWLSGVGGGNFSDGFRLYNELQLRLVYARAHMDYLQFLIEYGLIGFSLYFSIILLTLYRVIYTLTKRRSLTWRCVAFMVLMAMMATGVHATMEFNLQQPATASMLVVFLALGWIASCTEPGTRKRRRRKKTSEDGSSSDNSPKHTPTVVPVTP